MEYMAGWRTNHRSGEIPRYQICVEPYLILQPQARKRKSRNRACERTCGQKPQASTPLPSASRVPTESCLRPRSKMTFADAVSRSSSHPHSQECHRSSNVFLRTVPQWGQVCDVLDGSTKTTLRPAHAALTLTIAVNVLHPASKIDLFNPALALAPLGRYFPFSSCLPCGNSGGGRGTRHWRGQQNGLRPGQCPHLRN